MTLLAGGAARRESVTVDEVAHTGAGVSYLQKLDMRLNGEHPPLAKVLAAIPLVLRGAHADYTHLSWTFSDSMFNAFLGEWPFGHWLLMTWNDPHSTLFWARLPMLLLTLLLGVVIYTLGSRLSNDWGGLLSLTAYATTPAFLAFGPLVLTDMPVALFWVLTIWQLPNLWRDSGRGTVLKFGLALAGALLSKFSSGLLFIVVPVFALSLRLRPLPGQPADEADLRAWRRRAWGNLIKGTLWAALFVYVVYFVLSWNQSTDSFSVIPHFPASPILRRLLMPPWNYVRGVLSFALSALSRPTYILGHDYPHGVWFYFPTLFLLKSQLAFLLLLVLAGGLAIVGKFSAGKQFSAIASGMEMHWRSIWISVLVFVTACMLNRLNLSIRHFSIALALSALLLAPLARVLRLLRGSSPRLAIGATGLTVALAATCLVTAVEIYPNYLPFLNTLAMGKPGYNLVNDSNLDWNQSLPAVEEFARRQRLHQLLLDEYGFSDPTAYVPEAQLWDCQQPSRTDAGQWAVISANYVRDAGNCSWLMQYRHESLGGGSMYAIRLPELIPAAGEPGGPPLQQEYHYFGGFPGLDIRPMFQKCIRDPQQLQPTMDWIKTTMGQLNKKSKK